MTVDTPAPPDERVFNVRVAIARPFVSATVNGKLPVPPSVTLRSASAPAGGVRRLVYVQVTVSPAASVIVAVPDARSVTIVLDADVQDRLASDQPACGCSTTVQGCSPARVSP